MSTAIEPHGSSPGAAGATSLRPLSISHGSLEHSLPIPTKLHFHASQLRDQFLTTLPVPTEEFANDDEPASEPELLGRFLSFIADNINKEAGNVDGADREVLKLVYSEFQSRFLRDNNIHAATSTLTGTPLKRMNLIRCFYNASTTLGHLETQQSTLFQTSKSGRATIYAVFGGQGNIEDYFAELRDLYETYRPVLDGFLKEQAQVLYELSRDERTGKVYAKGLDVMKWLHSEESTPDTEYLVSAPVSLPLIGLVQLCHFYVTCKTLGMSPGDFRQCLKGVTGHSQGIITAAAVASSTTWEGFSKLAEDALRMLFWIGCRSQQTYPKTSLTPSMLQDSVAHGEGIPSPMLSIRDLTQMQVESHVRATNQHLPKDRQLHISLINGPRNIVVTGPPMSLYGLNLSLRKIKAPTGLDQNRLPFTERKLRFTNRFLPISAPFHSPYLAAAAPIIDEDLKDITSFSRQALGVPVYHTNTGKDVSEDRGDSGDSESLVSDLVRMITNHPVHWELATSFRDATHILDFGPGGVSGLGVLTHRNKEGTGVRVILAGTLEGTNPEIGYKSELFDTRANAVKYAEDWVKLHGPRLVQTRSGRTFVDTKFSRLLGKPPIMVAGMTPCTVPWDFVAATMNAGYHVELAAGGYYNEKGLTEAIRKIQENTVPGTGITINLIYVNPRAMSWQIPLIGKLRAEGSPIEGITIGAGVPSLEVANEYIRTLGLRHISFKPGSIDGLQQVISIAKANPTFPIVCQWTGGRGGGHHSFEDFHQPILQMYGRIRRCHNIVLVAGSGFGGCDDTYPYLTGAWSTAYKYPPMPFDGILLGSRIMVAKEAHTSYEAKVAITQATGLDDKDWEKTYKGPAGGVITVLSEMGEPIHKLATRGVQFWAEMDKKIFSLDKTKRLLALQKDRDYIIKRLNADFQKTWFGRNKSGQPVDVEEMTYSEVVERLIELTFVRHEKRWIDKSLKGLVTQFVRRIEERFAPADGIISIIQSEADLDDPTSFVERLVSVYPASETQLVNSQDVQHFLLLCKAPKQKPVPFVPALDGDFEYWFKKDSLWQSEDLAAVVDQDVGRTCILQGPVAVKYSTVVDEPVKDILEGIHDGHLKKLLKDLNYANSDVVPVVEYFGGILSNTSLLQDSSEGIKQSTNGDTVVVEIPTSGMLPDEDGWLNLLGGSTVSWRQALFTSAVFVQGNRFQANPVRRLFSPSPGMVVELCRPESPEETTIALKEQQHSGGPYITTCRIFRAEGLIHINLVEWRTADSKPVVLPLQYFFKPEVGTAPIHEKMDDRNERIKRFYFSLWFGEQACPPLDSALDEVFKSEPMEVSGSAISDFVHAVGNSGEAFVERAGKVAHAPMDFAIVVGWKSIIKAIFPRSIDGDLLQLVHLSNSFRMFPGAEPLRKGDVTSTSAQINAVLNQASGKLVEVCGIVYRNGTPVMEVTSQFLYRGKYTDFSNTFQRITEQPMKVHLETTKDVAVLRSKDWFTLHNSDTDLLNKVLTFRLTSFVTFKNQTVFRSVQTRGPVFLELPTKEIIQVATVNYTANESFGNPVLDYLQRCGSMIEQPVHFDNAIPLNSKTRLLLRAPASNEGYARVSGDYNPIHVSRVFAKYANLAGTITHGMYTSAAVRSLVEIWAADNNVGRVRSFSCSFVGMVLPNDDIETKLHHIGMVSGRKIIKVEARKKETDEPVLLGEAEVEQPVTAYVFTGQGSQEQGMGMDLYESSPVAREVWDRADKHFLDNYGFAITNIVRNNPKELTVHFGGPRGKAIRNNYMAMTFESIGPDGTVKSEKIFKEIDENTLSYTYRSPNGLLSATQFTQPALTLMEKASFEDMQARGLVQRDSVFAGHSLGEYSALAALAEVMPIESLVSVVFYRGLTMQVAVERDHLGRSNYSMCAVNPSRVSPDFDETALKYIVQSIEQQSKWLLEVVNYNVANQQYVCAGDLRALDTLTSVLNFLKVRRVDIASFKSMNPEDRKSKLEVIVRGCLSDTMAKAQPIELERGLATIPLKGIDVPFHSSFLRSGVKPFRNFLLKKIIRSTIDPNKLIGKYIPNVTAKPFQLTREYFEEVYELTNSPKIASVLANWEKYETVG